MEARVQNSIVEDQRGAVLAEFVIAIVPLLTMFFAFVQLGQMATAKLVQEHGAIIGARAAAVYTNEHKTNPTVGEGMHDGEVLQGVKMGMKPFIDNGQISNVRVTVEDESSEADPYGWVTVEVRATYHCNVPMGAVVCGGRTKELKPVIMKMPHQGAVYNGGAKE
jgi:hypothetical protein